MKVINYKETGSITSASFVKHSFLVHVQGGLDNDLSKMDKIQELYKIAKPAIDYETELYKQGKANSITVDVDEVEGEYIDFTPAGPTPIELVVDFLNLTGEVLDQYGEFYSDDIEFSVEGSDKVRIEDNKFVKEEVEVSENYSITARYGELTEERSETLRPKVDYEDEQETQENELEKINAKLDNAILELTTLIAMGGM